MKKILVFLLSAVLCMSLNMISFAANETNTAGVIFTAELDKASLNVSDQDQSVVLTVKASEPVSVSSISYTASANGLKVAKLEGDGTYETGATTNLDTGKFSWSATGGVETTVETLSKVTFTVPANTPAGTYTLGVSAIKLTKDYGMTVFENGATASATLTIAEATPGYTVSMSADPASVEAGQEFDVKLDVTSDDKENFNTLYAELSYDKDLVEYAGEKTDSVYADVDGYSISKAVSDTNSAEKLILKTYGDTNIAVSKSPDLTLLFKAKADAKGDAAFSLKNAQVDELDHAYTDAAPAASGDTISVKITEPKVYYTVTFDTNEHGTAPQDQTVESGQKATDPGELTAEGWTFGGWYKEAACTTAWNFETDTVTGDVTLYAKWTEIKPEVDTKTDYLSGYTLVIATLENADGYIPAYDGKAMYKVASVEGQSAYGDSTYYYVVKNEDYDVSKVKCIKSDSNTIEKDGDANQTTVIDINDAQFIYNLYNSVQVTYTPAADQLLASDVNGNGSVDMNDCAAAIAAIPVQWS